MKAQGGLRPLYGVASRELTGGAIKTIRSFKIRIYPTAEQEELLWKHIGSCRYIWNYMLALQQTRYENGEKHLSAFDMNKLLTPLKKEEDHAWLKEVSISSLQRTCADLAQAYSDFFKKSKRHPKFKSRKKSKKSYPVSIDTFYLKDGKAVKVQNRFRPSRRTRHKVF